MRSSALHAAVVGICILSAAVLPRVLQAEEQGAQKAENDWRFRVTPYLWAAGLDGRFSQAGLPVIETSADFGDVLDALDAGGMLAFEARRGRFGVFADTLYISLSESGQVAAVGLDATASSRTTTALVSGSYRAWSAENFHLDVLAGLRYWSLDSKLQLRAPIRVLRRQSERWVDPMAGVKGRWQLTTRSYLTGWAMVGGFGVGADSASDLLAGWGYELRSNLDVLISYRRLSVDYDEDAFLFDAAQHGPGIGVRYLF